MRWRMMQARRRSRCWGDANILLFLLAFASLLRCMPGEDTADTDEVDKTYRFDAIVIGAGWAGINAARHLKAYGVRSVLVVEAEDYVGGRSRSFNEDGSVNQPPTTLLAGNVPYDAGSEWLYTDQTLTNYLYQTGHLYHVDVLDENDDYLPLAKMQYYRQHKDWRGHVRTTAMEKSEATRLKSRVWDTFTGFANHLWNIATEPDMSYHEAAERYRALISDEDRRYFEAALKSVGQIEYTANLTDLSLTSDLFFDGSEDMHYMSSTRVGFGNTAAAVAFGIGCDFLVGSKVTRVDYSRPEVLVTIEMNGGLTQAELVSTVVAVTVPLGVLKANSISFVPPLPSKKQQVIDKMKVGVSNKCIMIWDSPGSLVWPKDEIWFTFMPLEDTSGQVPRWTTFSNLSKYKGKPVLVGWIGGDDARHIESLTDDEVLDEVMISLREMFPAITRPDRVIVTRWASEPNFLGAYSYKSVGRSFSSDSAILAKPVGDRLFFAGEATAGAWYATTTGAWTSGYDAAVLMIKALLKSNENNAVD